MDIEKAFFVGIRVNAPEFYKDPAFLEWLNDPETQVFTWHKKGDAPNEYSDIMVGVDTDGYDGTDSDMPEHIWLKIVEAVDESKAIRHTNTIEDHVWVHISNLEE